MAESRELQLVTTMKDKMSGKLSKISGRTAKLGATFSAMAVAGTAATSKILKLEKKLVDKAARAEGAYNKFNTVFAENREEMTAWLNKMDKRLPVARDRIARLTAGVGDLLKPMGVADDRAAEMSRDYTELATKIAAFNDVNPKTVLQDMKSAMQGQSRPMAKYGVNARENALAQKAVNMELVESATQYRSLAGQQKQQIRLQALQAQMFDQSKNAIKGYNKNKDSYIFKTMRAQAETREMKVALGEALLPAFTAAVEKITPVITKFANWAQEHETLVKWIFYTTTAITALIALAGILGMLYISWQILAGGAAIAQTALAVAVQATFSPFTAIIAVIAAVVAGLVWLWNHVEETRAFLLKFGKAILNFFTYLPKQIWKAIKKIPGMGFVMKQAEKAFKFGKGIVTGNVGDALITSDGEIIEFSPKDDILASQNLGKLKGGARSKGSTYVKVEIKDGMYLDRNAGRKLAQTLSDELGKETKLAVQ